MSVGKFTSLEEVRKNPTLRDRFIKERTGAKQDKTSEARFEAVLRNTLRLLLAHKFIQSVQSDSVF